MSEIEVQEKITQKIFSEVLRPDFAVSKSELLEKNSKLVHYTSAEAALKIIRSRNIWLRQTKLMNDYSEIEYGIKQLLDAYNSEKLNLKFKEFFESLSPQMMPDFEKAINHRLNQFRFNTYVLSIAEHEEDENNYGRLSMWRGYGRSSGVAIVVNPDYIEDENSKLPAYVLPTQYLDSGQFFAFLDSMLDRCLANIELFKKLPLKVVLDMFQTNFAFIFMGTKHPGFSEEKEWRVIANPVYFGAEGLVTSVETISGVPQKVLNLPLSRLNDKRGSELSLNDLIERIIIGPSDAAYEIREALVVELENKGVVSPHEKVHVSNIPYRES